MKYLFLLFSFVCLSSCSKWLDKKANLSDVTPESLKDYQALLDEEINMTRSYPGMGALACDDYYTTYALWLSAPSSLSRNGHIWKADFYEGSTGSGDWAGCYIRVAYANIVLEGLDKIVPTSANQAEWNAIRGAALFFRAHAFHDLAQLYAKPYSTATASTDLGIPLRLMADIHEPSVRSTLQQTYDQVISDLLIAESLLPVTPAYKHRPSKPAAEALLARTYLNMENYAQCRIYADKALNNFSVLLDYNLINPSPTYPFPAYQNVNPEVIFYAEASSYSFATATTRGIIDTALYNSYNTNDLRRGLFFRDNGMGGVYFRGTYVGQGRLFSGISANELYLMRAECNARLGNVTAAMNDLNALLIRRWKATLFNPVTAVDQDDALSKILLERRKELVFVGNLRWEDLRRLNKDPRFQKTLLRILNGVTYTLPPNDNRYVYPIPETEIKTYGMQQNPR